MGKLYCYQNFRQFPYYKVQWRDTRSLAWRDVQQVHPTPAAAQAAFLPGKQCRVMEVREQDRSPLAS